MLRFTRHRGNFAQCLEGVANAQPKQTYASVAQYIDERMKQGAYADACREGAWGPASFNEVSGNILATRAEFNPLLAFPEQAVKAMRTGEFYLTNEVLLGDKPASQVLAEIAEADANKPYYRERVINLGKAVTRDVPTDSFADAQEIAFLAEGKTRAQKYGRWLRNLRTDRFPEGLGFVKVYHQNLVGKDKSRGFWLYRLDDCDRSDFYCYDRSLYSDGGSLFGESEGAEGTPRQKFQRII